uniref:Peroxisomal ATPase PEX6 n=1 Tax=Culicoides sonorensis TaxID=179676 RepID=A0A336LXA6_CULSO
MSKNFKSIATEPENIKNRSPFPTLSQFKLSFSCPFNFQNKKISCNFRRTLPLNHNNSKMKLQKNISLISYICKILSIKDDYSMFPYFIIYKVIGEFLQKLSRKSCTFRVYLERNDKNLSYTKSDVSTEHCIFVNSKVWKYYCNSEDDSWIQVEIRSQSENDNRGRFRSSPLIYQLIPVDDLHPISACFTTAKGYNELYHTLPSRHLYVSFRKCDFIPQPMKNASIAIISYHELSNSDADFIIGRYFETPRFLHNHQAYEIELEQDLLGSWYYAEYFMSFSKLKKLIFCVTHLENKNGKTESAGIVMKNLTTLHQVPSDHRRIPRKVYQSIDFPLGLKSYVGQLVASIEPFLNKSYVEDYTTQPIFLVEGSRGSGQEVIVAATAERLGFSINYVDCVELMTSLAAQTESKLSNIMLKSTSHHSLIICFENFEVFGASERNNQADLRLIMAFETMLDQFFAKNKSSIIVACSNNLITQWKLRSLFLETVTIKGLSKAERLQTLIWLFEKKENLGYDRSDTLEFLHQAVEKTNGLNFGDLQTLVDNFLIDHMKKEGSSQDVIPFALDAFEKESDELFKSCKENTLSIPKVEWSEIGGLADLKTEIQNSIKLPIKHKHLMGKYMKRSGILLHGPPGTGKTLIAKAVATEHQINFLSVQGPELLNMYVGQSEENVRAVFANAKANSPCVVFLDELDSLAPNRGNSADSGGVMDRVVSQLLAELDAILADPNCQIFILGATNRPDLIDPALLRPGRFDKLLYVGAFTKQEEKIAVLETVTAPFQLGKEVALAELSKTLKAEITGAEVYALCSNAWLSAVRKTVTKTKDAKAKLNLTKEGVSVETSDFQEAMKALGLGKKV